MQIKRGFFQFPIDGFIWLLGGTADGGIPLATRGILV